MATPDVRPVHVVVDCSPPPAAVFDEDGNLVPIDAQPRITHIPVTEEEWAEMKAAEAGYIEALAAREAESQQLARGAAAHPDPLVQELARRAGILP